MPAFNQQQYALLFTVIGGQLLAEMQDLEMDTDGNHQIIKTMVKGMAGMSMGGPVRTLQIQSAVPQNGFEFDPNNYVVQMITANIQVWGPNNKKSSGQVWIPKSSIGQGVDKAASLKFTCVGPASAWQ